MTAVLVALHLVACQPDLLICQDLAASKEQWQDMRDCEAARETEMQLAKDTLPEEAVVMSRCRYMIGRDQRSLQIF
ncbi:hypothetical protein [Labrenzia sp. PHM005]|uniref:hypothetical protein n=1 Tax=Labrenzia sp. PHM005 TaxID=2590016 RepID=UPI001140078D|nr:hypothetical protein [Labrenzia sp. PHM005]QDG79144.1 hypothetical protein FJ695_26570 [Labrenzia sp. PHM005]